MITHIIIYKTECSIFYYFEFCIVPSILLTKFTKSVGVCPTQSDYLRDVVMFILLYLKNMIL